MPQRPPQRTQRVGRAVRVARRARQHQNHRTRHTRATKTSPAQRVGFGSREKSNRNIDPLPDKLHFSTRPDTDIDGSWRFLAAVGLQNTVTTLR